MTADSSTEVASGKRTAGSRRLRPSPPRPDGRGNVAPGWYLLVLRLFLGVTFTFAGLQKLANPAFFRDDSPISIHTQMLGAAHTSPVGGLLVHLAGVAPEIGWVIALGELAVGIGTILGLLTRVAAFGGALISLSLFLTVSYSASPYFTGSDVVFLFAWTPIFLAGAGGAPAIDTWLAHRPARAPVHARSSDPNSVTRRSVVSRGALIGLVAAAGAVLAGVIAGLGRSFAPASGVTTPATLPGPTSSTTTTTTTTPTTTSTTAGGGSDPSTSTSTVPTEPKGTSIGPAGDVPIGGSSAFTDPSTGDPSLVIQKPAGTFVAFDAVCPHEGCTVAFQPSADIIACPCHGSEFNPRTGALVRGPATYGLTRIHMVEGANGDLYVV